MRAATTVLFTVATLALCRAVPCRACGGAPPEYARRVQAIVTPVSAEGAIKFPKPDYLLESLSYYETSGKPKLAAAVDMLDPKRPFTQWREALTDLSEGKAYWTLTVALCHPDVDVRITAARALQHIPAPFFAPVHARFLIGIAKATAFIQGGSENATLHGIFQHELAQVLNQETGASVSLHQRQDPEALRLGEAAWENAIAEKVKAAVSQSK